MPKFKVNDRVVEPIDPFAKQWVLKYGTVLAIYNDRSRTHPYCFYPELYEVMWDSGKIQRGYLPDGLSLESEAQEILKRVNGPDAELEKSICPHCKNYYNTGLQFCPSCGLKIKALE